MVGKKHLAAALVILAIAASFYTASIGLGLVSNTSPALIPTAQISLAPAECNTDAYLEQWQQGKITLSELMQKFEAKKAGKSC